MIKYCIICHDGTFNGDCSFDATVRIPLNINITHIQLPSFDELPDLYKKAFAHVFSEQDWLEWGKEQLDELKGAWVIKETLVDKIVNATKRYTCGNDSQAYTMMSAIKCMLAEFSDFIIGEDAQDKEL